MAEWASPHHTRPWDGGLSGTAATSGRHPSALERVKKRRWPRRGVEREVARGAEGDNDPEEPLDPDEIVAQAEAQRARIPGDEGADGGIHERFLSASATAFTGLLLAVLLGFVAVFTGVGPELFGHIEGGMLDLQIMPSCDTPFRQFLDRPCFEHVNATITDASGSTRNVSLSKHMMGWDARIPLETARATLDVQTDQGTWTQEVWIPQNLDRSVSIDPEDPQQAEGVLGREPGLAFLSGVGAAAGLLLLVASGLWLVRGTLGAASATRGLLTLWLWLLAFVMVIALFTATTWLLPPILALWFFVLRKGVSGWIRRREVPAAE